MVKSDILLDDEGIEMIPAEGAVDVNAGPNETPGIRLVPATASLRLGGGTHANNSVAGALSLVNDIDETTISVDADPTGGSGGGLSLSTASGIPTAMIDGGTGSMTLGGSGENGTLSVRDGAGTTVDLDTTNGVARLGQSGGKLGLELDPGNGLFSVVDTDGNPVFQVDADGVVTFGSGAGKVGMDLDPENGLFSIVDADGEPVFQIDTQAKTVNTAKGYSRGTIDDRGP